jgi:hypothetical protein
MNMKKLLEACGGPDPMGMGAPDMSPEMDKGTPVTVNVSMNASGKEHVEDLIAMMKNAGMDGAGEVGKQALPAITDVPHQHDSGNDGSMRGDMEKFMGMMEPESDMDEGGSDVDMDCAHCSGTGKHGEDDCTECGGTGEAQPDGALNASYTEASDGEQEMDFEFTGDDGEVGPGMLHYTVVDGKVDPASLRGTADPMDAPNAKVDDGLATDSVKPGGLDHEEALSMAQDEYDSVDEWANSAPDTATSPTYGNYEDNIHDGDDLHKSKKSYKVVSGGDNPMQYSMEVESIKAALYAALTEKKMSEGEVPAGLKAYQDKKGKGKAPAKGKSKSGKMPMDAGKDGKKGTKDDKPAFLKKEEMAAEGRGKVMAGKGRGKKPKLMAGRGRGK